MYSAREEGNNPVFYTEGTAGPRLMRIPVSLTADSAGPRMTDSKFNRVGFLVPLPHSTHPKLVVYDTTNVRPHLSRPHDDLLHRKVHHKTPFNSLLIRMASKAVQCTIDIT